MATVIDSDWLTANGGINGPWYLSSANTTYQLATDPTALGSAFAITASGVTLDLNSHTITYDNATPISISNGEFEDGTTGWDFSGAAQASVYLGSIFNNDCYNAALTNNYSLKFALPAADQYVVSTDTITLLANTTYSLSAMFMYAGGSANTTLYPIPAGSLVYVSLVPASGTTRTLSMGAVGTGATLAWSQNTRGIQLWEKTFTTGGSDETYYVHVGVTGAGAGTRAYYVDDIKIQRTAVYGVDLGPAYQRATNATVKNGTITQGADGATWAHALRVYSSNGITLRDLVCTINGANSSCVFGYDIATFTTTIHDCTFTSNVKTITSRDNANGAVINHVQGDFYSNTITAGPHVGFGPAMTVASHIYDNVIALQGRYTNGFAIVATAGDSTVYGNTINCGSGANAARGVYANGKAGHPTKVYSNTIAIQELANNQEYGGAIPYGSYGIQCENADNVEVYSNTVTAYANATLAFAFRQDTGSGSSGHIYVHDNTFKAVSDGTHHASCLKFGGDVTSGGPLNAGNITFEDNTLETNDGIGQQCNDAVLTLTRSHLKVNTPIITPHPFDPYWSATQADSNVVLTFLDATFEDAGSESYFRAASAAGSGGASTNWVAFALAWSTTVNVKDSGDAPVVGVAVSVKDKNNTAVFSGNTDASGNVVATPREFQTVGNTKTTYSPFTASSGTTNTTFTANGIKTVSLISPGAGVAPEFVSSDSFSAYENQTAVGQVQASGDATILYTITGGADQAKFDIDADDETLTFKVAPDFEIAGDANSDNTYVVVVTATNVSGAPTQTISVAVLNLFEPTTAFVRVVGSRVLMGYR